MSSQLNNLVVQQRHIELVSHVKQAQTATRVPLPTQEVPTEPTFFTDINQYGMNTRRQRKVWGRCLGEGAVMQTKTTYSSPAGVNSEELDRRITDMYRDVA